MEKYVVLTRLTVFDENFEMYEGIYELLCSLNEDGHNLIVISHDQHSLIIMKKIFRETFNFEISCVFRRDIRENIDESNAKDYILIGSSDDDLILAANKRILIINPGWSIKQDEKPARYGITLERPNQLFEAIRLIANQNRWYFKLDVGKNATVLALTSANTMNRDVRYSEREILDGFENLLKSGDRKYINTLYFHLISGVMKSSELRNVELWGTFPSSSSSINEELEELKERCRYLTGRRMTQPLFIRHTPAEKSHYTVHATRLSQGCTKHFDSIILNPYYNSSRIRGKVVCVIDDYLTNGISFETARNLLLQAGASKVILLALGRYKRGAGGIYQHEVYNLTGRINRAGYNYQLVSRNNLVGTYDPGARDEVSRIYEILND
ncbi:phosphoribosyltransferase [Metabacillus herbersteinensis]|uniref:Phosphoribosyltransferase n=1 Tax=Metabacillus herbersteinensis TaxID=283816 RepID=A0ABV6GIP1_9BACI